MSIAIEGDRRPDICEWKFPRREHQEFIRSRGIDERRALLELKDRRNKLLAVDTSRLNKR